MEAEFCWSPGGDSGSTARTSPSKVTVEIHGSCWSGGRHTTGDGFRNDRIKRDLAEDQGFKVLRA
jgi:hypothetical protein